VNVWQSYKQECGCLMHFARLATTLQKDEESARDNHVVVPTYPGYPGKTGRNGCNNIVVCKDRS